jgi:hypothetical protein
LFVKPSQVQVEQEFIRIAHSTNYHKANAETPLQLATPQPLASPAQGPVSPIKEEIASSNNERITNFSENIVRDDYVIPYHREQMR